MKEEDIYKENANNVDQDDFDLTNDFDSFSDENNMEDTDDDLLALLDLISSQDESQTYEDDLLTVQPTEVNEEPFKKNAIEPEDFIALNDLEESSMPLSNMEEEKQDDLLGDLFDMNIFPEIDKVEDEVNNEDISNVGDAFSKAVSAVDLIDNDTEEKFAKLTKELTNNTSKEDEKAEIIGIFHKIFGKKNESKNKQDDVIEKKAKKAKKKKKTKAKASSSLSSTNSDEDSPKTKASKEKASKKQASKKKAKEKVKKAKVKPAKKAKSIVKEVNEEVEVIQINKLAVIFAATLIILISGFVTLGTNIYSYSLNIKNASTELERHRYKEAYKHIYGLDIKDKDKELYDKIMTVMYVYKEVSSYDNYMAMEKYPEALDSLLKGLERYEKYIGQAKELGVKEDLDMVKSTILDNLSSSFNLTEKEAKRLNKINDQAEYSIEVINIASKTIKTAKN